MHRFSVFKNIIFLVLLVIVIVGFFSYRSVLGNGNKNMTVISITEDGPVKTEPNFNGYDFGELFPGQVKSKILRIENGLKHEVLVKNLYVKLELFKDGKKLDKNNKLAKNYMDNMKIKVEFKAPKSESRKELFDGSFTEFADGIDCKIPIQKGLYADVFYTILMDERTSTDFAGVECNANLTAKVVNIDFEGKSKEVAKRIPDLDGHWAADGTSALISRGIIKGYPDGSIRPNDNITRAEAAVIIARSMNYSPTGKKVQFKDPIPEWAADYVAELVYDGVFTGYPDGKFYPNDFISRQEAVCGIVKALGDSGLEEELGFRDAGEVGDWAKSWVRTGVEHNIVSGYPDNSFRPKKNVSRAEVFVMICRALGLK